MIIRVSLQSVTARALMILVGLGAIALLVRMTVTEFSVGILSDNRLELSESFLATAVLSVPNSGRLLYASALAESSSPTGNLEQARENVVRAIELSPHNYNYSLLLARICEAQKNKICAEEAFRESLKLAPHYSETHWNLANFLIRVGKPESAVEHLAAAANLDPTLIAPSIDLVWTTSNKNIDALHAVTNDNPRSHLPLALFFARQKLFPEAAETFAKVDREAAFSATDTPVFFDTLIKNGYPVLAQKLWLQLAAPEEQNELSSNIWNGDFESRTLTAFPQFDWQIKRSDYARIQISQLVGHSGSHSLQFEFTGRDTTVLNREVTHLFAARSGVNYRLDFFVKTENFTTPEGPRVIVFDEAGNRLGASDPIFANKDWKLMSFNFTAPKKNTGGDGIGLFISFERKPRLSYDEPTKGRVWFDDFVLSEANRK